MRRLISLVAALVSTSLAASSAPLYAQPLPATAFVAQPNQVGVAAAVHGSVQLAREGAVGTNVKSGAPVFLGDAIVTDGSGSLQILLLDQTVFTIGPNSRLIIDEFVYDPSSAAGNVTATIAKGTFRFVTGKIAKRDPKNMKVKVPSGTIGIRGTMVAGRVDGQEAFVVLLGPGPNNKVGERPGAMLVSTDVGQTFVDRPNFGTRMTDPSLPPTPPAVVPEAEIKALASELAPPPAPMPYAPDQTRSGDPRGPQSPDGTAQPPVPGTMDPNAPHDPNAPMTGGPNAPMGPMPTGAYNYMGDHNGPMNTAFMSDGFQGPYHFDSTMFHDYSQLFQNLDAYTSDSAQGNANSTTQVANGLATYDDLRKLDNGVFHYGGNGVFTQTVKDGNTANINGTMLWSFEINFGNRTVGGGNSHVNINTSSAGGNIARNEMLEAQSFGTGSGYAAFTDVSGDNRVTTNIHLNNYNGVVARDGTIVVNFDAGTGPSHQVGTGVDNSPRQSGPAP